VSQGKLEQEQRALLVEQGKRLKDTIAAVERELVVVEGSLQREGQRLPNLSHPQVPHKSATRTQTHVVTCI
jgi:seryl-tRNA synthetase